MSLFSVMILESLESETRNYLLQQEPSISPIIQIADKSWHLLSGVGESLTTTFPSLPSPELCWGIWEWVKNDTPVSFTLGTWRWWLHEEGHSETRMRLLWQVTHTGEPHEWLSKQSTANQPSLLCFSYKWVLILIPPLLCCVFSHWDTFQDLGMVEKC